jgi:hypothetical protein
MEIGEPQRVITVEPIEDPIPSLEPDPDGDREPDEAPTPARDATPRPEGPSAGAA